MESKEIMPANNWVAMKDQALMLVKSGFLPVSINTPEKAIAIILTAKELGIGAMEGFRSINVIQGKPSVSPQLMLALAYRTGKLKEIKFDSTEERTIVTITREGKSPHTEEFGVKEATSLGLIGKDNYSKQRKTMMKWRALAANLRVTFPDVVLGLYTPEELGADVVVGEGDQMEVVQSPPPQAKPVEPAAPQGKLEVNITPESVDSHVSSKNGSPYWTIQDTEGVKYYTADKMIAENAKRVLTAKGSLWINSVQKRFNDSMVAYVVQCVEVEKK